MLFELTVFAAIFSYFSIMRACRISVISEFSLFATGHKQKPGNNLAL